MTPCFISVVVPIAPGTEAAVRGVLRGLDVSGQIGSLHLVHFMSMTVIAEPHLPNGLLLLELTADAPAAIVLPKLAASLHDAFDLVLRTARVARYAPTDLAGLLASHVVDFGTNWTAALRRDRVVGLPFTGIPGMSVGRIQREEALTRHILGTGLLHGPDLALEKLRRIRAAIWAEGHFKWAFQALDTPFLHDATPATAWIWTKIYAASFGPLLWPLLAVPLGSWLVARWLGSAAPAWTALGVTVVAVVALGAFLYRTLVAAEATDIPDDTPPCAAAVERIMADENRGPINLLVTVSRLKEGWFRRLALRAVFRLTQFRLAGRGRPGFLGVEGAVGTLHSGRWLVLPGTDLLIFAAHYDGSWLSYMQDFVDLIPYGPTAIWTNARGFPRTRLLFKEGAADGDRVTRWFHRQQRPIDFRYAASDGLPLGRIRANARIRQGFAGAETEADAQAWLSLFGAPSPSTRAALPRDSDEIPTLAYGALTKLQQAACLVLQFDGTAESCRAWLAGIAPGLAYGRFDHGHGRPALVLALSAGGLRRLGLNEADLATFPTAFSNGMASAARARVLGDTPAEWAWGGPDTPADAVLLVYARHDNGRSQTGAGSEPADSLAGVIDRVTGAGPVKLLARIDLQTRDRGDAEPFGFRDGLSQPVIPGTPAFDRHAPPGHVVAPGEFVLGHPDSSGFEPSMPTVHVDPARPPHRLPFAGNGRAQLGRAQIGRDSSFLVVRQLRQDVERFKRYTAEQADRLGQSPEYIGAKLLGRWPDGSSLVRHPHRPGHAPDNDFRFVAEDPDGLGCPRGAHIRRANPRDVLHPDLDNAIRITNRRRILRVGRPYVDRPGGPPQGMLFMCLNADIERQFELVQQAWMQNADFDGLRDETDPLLGRRDDGPPRSFTIPTRQGPVCLKDLPDFVSVVGGGYFWMPSRAAAEFLAHLPADVAGAGPGAPVPSESRAAPAAPARTATGCGRRMTDAEEDVSAARAARAAAPHAPGPAFELCIALLRRQDPEAMTMLATLEQFPGFAPGWDELAQTLAAGHPAAAAVAWRRAAQGYAVAEAARPTAAAALRLGQVLRQLDDRPAARAALERATTRDPSLADAWFALGLSCQDLGDPAAAVHAFAAALLARPDFHETAFNLGVARQETGDLDAALDAYAQAWRLRPGSFGRIAQALVSPAVGRLWLRPSALQRELAARS